MSFLALQQRIFFGFDQMIFGSWVIFGSWMIFGSWGADLGLGLG